MGKLTDRMGGFNWSDAKIAVLKAFVKTRTGDKLGELGERNSAWEVLEREWKAKSFSMTRTARLLAGKHLKLRQKASKTSNYSVKWSDAEEKALLAFVKDRKGDKFATLGDKNSLWEVLEREWKEKGFGTTRKAVALGNKHAKLRRKAGRAVDRTRWSAAEEMALLALVKDRTGNEFGSLGRATNSALGDLEREWKGKGKGFTTTGQPRR